MKKSFDGVLTDDEINEYYLTLYQLTRDIISHYSSLRSQDLIALERLRSSQIQFKAKISHVSELHELIRFIKEHINSVLTYIAPQFACHARCAFIGKRILMSFVDSGDITSNEVDGFLSHISTIATDLLADMGDKSLSDKVIEKKYGHLRNSTYNILAKKYTDIGINRLRGRNLPASSQEGLVYGNEIFEPIANYFCCSTKEIDEFVVGSIKMRELLKFEYSRSVSLILDAIEIMAQMLLMVTEEIAFVYLDDLLSIKDTFDMGILSSKLKSLSSRNKRRYNKFQELLYPAVITSYYDFFALKIYEDRPNFITTRKVVGDIVFCTERMLDEECETLNLDNRIIVIEKAEPGNDWIFSKYKITGLIAKYGGAASHMAIRCLELGIPAALGCGEKIFRYLSECSRIVLDCKNETISRIL